MGPMRGAMRGVGGGVSLDAYVLFVGTGSPTTVTAVRRALGDAGIPYRSGLLAGPPPQVIFYVPQRRLRDAHHVVGPFVDDDEHLTSTRAAATRDATRATDDDGPARLPVTAIAACLAVVAINVAIVHGWIQGPFPPGPRLLAMGGLVQGTLGSEPWRLVTSLWLHADLRHALSNGVGLLVFGVALIVRLGLLRSAALYLTAGIGGGFAAMALAAPGMMVIGSSGAVAGLFGAWVALAWREARLHPLGWRGRVRALGIGLLVLPSFLTPVTADGARISVSSHVGGMLTGMLVGALLFRTWVSGPEGPPFSERLPD